MTNIRRALQAAAAGGSDPVYVEDVFSIDVWDGDDTNGRNITNGIDLDGEGGMVWIKGRNWTSNHAIFDTDRPVSGWGAPRLFANTDNAEAALNFGLQAFQTNGYQIGNAADTNSTSPKNYTGWTFRKQAGFFDVVSWTGDSTVRNISHNLGSVPGCIMIKCTDTNGEPWYVYHRSADHAVGTDPQDYHLKLNQNYAAQNSDDFNDTAPTSTVFTVNAYNSVNGSGKTYVAYLFANNERIFGAGGDESIIKCGGISTSATYGNYKEDLGWEPQWLLMKRMDSTGDWFLLDKIRGITGPGDGALADTTAFNTLYATSDDAELQANTAVAESEQGIASLYSEGFIGSMGTGVTGGKFLYIAIRRPMKVPEAATDVFAVATRVTGNPNFTSNFVVDAAWHNPNLTLARYVTVFSRHTGSYYIPAANTDAESDGGTDFAFDFTTGWRQDGSTSTDCISWMWQRAPEFMDVVCYLGTGSATTVLHGLSVAPEMMIVRSRNQIEDWLVYSQATGNEAGTGLNETAATYTGVSAYWNSTSPTASVFSLGTHGRVNTSAKTYIAYLFATLAGISKVGSYTADGTLTTIDCGFSAGARFILIKRTDASGDWYLYDSVRGIVAGNDPYLLLNDEAAEVTGTDYIDPDNSGFQITAAGSSTINVDTGTYIFLAFA